MITEHPIEYRSAGRELVGVMYLPAEGEVAPGVLIAHEGIGQSDHERNVGRRLAELGYV